MDFLSSMGRSIPSFRQLIEIDKLAWSDFKKELKTKNDKKVFDSLFDSTKLYTPYLSFANRPLPIEPIMMGMLFHQYKILVNLENNNTNEIFGEDLEKVSLKVYEHYSKRLFEIIYDKWHGLIYSLHQGDREILLSMLVNSCNSLNEGAAKFIIQKESEISTSFYFFFCLLIENQKMIAKLHLVEKRKKVETSSTLFDFLD